MPEKTIKVWVKAPYRVVLEGDPHPNGDELSVPEEVAQHWLRSGCVERVISMG